MHFFGVEETKLGLSHQWFSWVCAYGVIPREPWAAAGRQLTRRNRHILGMQMSAGHGNCKGSRTTTRNDWTVRTCERRWPARKTIKSRETVVLFVPGTFIHSLADSTTRYTHTTARSRFRRQHLTRLLDSETASKCIISLQHFVSPVRSVLDDADRIPLELVFNWQYANRREREREACVVVKMPASAFLLVRAGRRARCLPLPSCLLCMLLPRC